MLREGDFAQTRLFGGALQPRCHGCRGAEVRFGRRMVSSRPGSPARVRRGTRQPLGRPAQDRPCGGFRCTSRDRLSPEVPVRADFPGSAANRSGPVRRREGKHQPQSSVLADAQQCHRLDDRIRCAGAERDTAALRSGLQCDGRPGYGRRCRPARLALRCRLRQARAQSSGIGGADVTPQDAGAARGN